MSISMYISARASLRRGLVLAAFAAACGDTAGSPDLTVPPDLSAARDLRPPPDLASPDVASPHFAAPPDLATAPDLTVLPDLTILPDLIVLPDLTILPDLIVLPDLLATCSDGVRNQDESDVDCGGAKCGKCADTKKCSIAADCASGVCSGGACAVPKCNDQVKNGSESDVDCGGTCPRCALGQPCNGAGDCVTATCTGGKCAPAASCRAIHVAAPQLGDGAYTIDADGPGGPSPAYPLWCDMTTDGGGWTLILKTDRSNAGHYVANAVNPASLSTANLDAVGKLDDDSIRALQMSTGMGAEIRAESPSLTAKVFMKGNLWSVPRPNSYSKIIETRISSANQYMMGHQCYDSDSAACGADHYCFGFGSANGPFTAEHMCVRRFASAGLWFNFGVFPAGYYSGRIWVR